MQNHQSKVITDSIFIQALKRQPTPRPPVWLMRQAGRYMPEYKQLRTRVATFTEFYKNPKICAEAALLPIDKFGFDASIVFSDILILPEAMGMHLEFTSGEGPTFKSSIRSREDLKQLKNIDPAQDLNFILEAIELTNNMLPPNIPLIGFIGSPWTLAAYMIEGAASKNFSVIRGLMYSDPEFLHQLLDMITYNATELLLAQIRAGAMVVQIFDSWAGLLSDAKYLTFSQFYIKKIIMVIKEHFPHVPVIVFAKNSGKCVIDLIDTGADALSLDWQSDIAAIKNLVDGKIALQGNLDPCVLYGTKKNIEAEIMKLLDLFKDSPGYVFNLGHGIYPDIPTENVEFMLNIIKSYKNNI